MYDRIIYDFGLLADIVEKIEIFNDEKIIYYGIIKENIKRDVKELPNNFNRCKVEVKLLDCNLFNKNNKKLDITFLIDNNYPFSFLQVLYSHFLDKVEFDEKIKKILVI